MSPHFQNPQKHYRGGVGRRRWLGEGGGGYSCPRDRLLVYPQVCGRHSDLVRRAGGSGRINIGSKFPKFNSLRIIQIF